VARDQRSEPVKGPTLRLQLHDRADVGPQRARPLDRAKLATEAAVRAPQRALDQGAVDNGLRRQRVLDPVADELPGGHQSLTRRGRPGAYSRCRRTSYTPGGTASVSCSSCSSSTGSPSSTFRNTVSCERCSEARSSTTTCA